MLCNTDTVVRFTGYMPVYQRYRCRLLAEVDVWHSAIYRVSGLEVAHNIFPRWDLKVHIDS